MLDSTKGWVLAFVALTIFFAVVSVTNHNEAIDAVLYGASAEAYPRWHPHNTRAILFFYSYRFIYFLVAGLGLNLSGYTILCGVTVLCAAGAVLLFYRLLRRGLQLSESSSVFGSLLLMSSYGFLRYANEIEIYIPSIFLVLAVVNALFDAERARQLTLVRSAVIGFFGGLVVAFYQPNALPLFFAGSVLFYRREDWPAYIAYGASGVTAFVLCVGWVYWADQGSVPTLSLMMDYVAPDEGTFFTSGFKLEVFIKAALAILHNFASINWAYGWPSVDGIVAKYQPRHYYFAREIFFAAKSYGWLNYVATFTFAATIVGWLFLLVKACRQHVSQPRNSRLAFVLIWLALNAGTSLYLNPGEREVWITTIPPAAALLSLYVFESLRGNRQLVAAMIALLFVHNVLGGLGMYRSSSGDLYGGSTAWIRDNGARGDWVVTSGAEHVWYNKMKLLYYPIARKSDATIADEFFNYAHFDGKHGQILHWLDGHDKLMPVQELLQTLATSPNRVFLTDDVVKPRHLPDRFDDGDRSDHLTQLGAFLAKSATVVDDGPFGKTYELDKARLAAAIAAGGPAP